MRYVGKKNFNLEKDEKKRTQSLNKMIGEKTLQPRKNRRIKLEKKMSKKFLL